MIDNLESKVNDLRSDLEQAEKSRQAGSLEDITEVFNRWNNENLLAQLVDALNDKEHDYESNLELLAIGLLGLARIYLDVIGTEFKKTHEREQLTEKLPLIQNLVKELKVEERVPLTMHGFPIIWYSEFQADWGKLYAHISPQVALKIFNLGIEHAQAVLAQAQQSLDSPWEKIPNNTDRSKWRAYLHQRYGVGALWALAILYARRGILIDQTTDRLSALSYAQRATKYSKYPERLQEIAPRPLN